MHQTLRRKRYQFQERLGKGAFGEVFKAIDTRNNKYVSIKCEPKNARLQTLSSEATILKKMSNYPGFPKFYWYGEEKYKRYLVMSLLSKSLEDQLQKFGALSLNSTIIIGDMVLSRLEAMHNENFIHRDIKPANILTGLERTQNTIYLVDFGLSKKYRDTFTKMHILYREGKSLTGTPRYASINNHQGIEQSWRDDLESLFYVIIHLFRGKLPWMGMIKARKMSSYEWYKKILNEKQKFEVSGSRKMLPKYHRELLNIYLYIKSIRFDAPPDYDYIRKALQRIAYEKNFSLQAPFEWTKKKRVKVKPKTLILKKTSSILASPNSARSSRRSSSISAMNSLMPWVQKLSNSNISAPSNPSSDTKGDTLPDEETKGPIFSQEVIRKIRPNQVVIEQFITEESEPTKDCIIM